jgi:hypothetical protein
LAGESSIERHADPLLAAPDRVAAAHELIGFDDERERWRHANRTCNIEPRAARRNVSHRAVDAAATAKGEHAVFQHSVSGRGPFLDHGSQSENIRITVRHSQ